MNPPLQRAHRCALAFSLTVLALPLAAEDRISLKDGSTLRGTVRVIEADGKIVVDSELTTRPVLLRSEALSSISFAVVRSSRPSHPELLHLVNGDILPGELTGLDEGNVLFETWYAGGITIPRKFVRSIDFGVAPQKLVYTGPQGLADWIDNDDWELEDGKLVCDTSGTIARPDVLPEQFILRFRIEWENSPNFRLYFCDDHLKRLGNTDRYYFEINSAGLQLKRQTAEGDRRWFNLASSSRRPEEFQGNGVEVEIRVDRERRLLYLYLDGEKVGRYPDPIDGFPTGSGIMLQSQAGGDMKNIVPLIEVFAWDAVSQLRRTEGHDDPKTDAIVDVDGEHHSGKALQLVEKDGKSRIVLQSPFVNDPLSIRTGRISTLYFKDSGEKPAPPAPISFDLRGGGKLRLTSLALGEEQLSARHPLLGKLDLSRDALEQLSVSPEDAEDKPASD